MGNDAFSTFPAMGLPMLPMPKKQTRGLVLNFVSASGFQHLIPRIREHIGRPHALQHVVVDNEDLALGR